MLKQAEDAGSPINMPNNFFREFSSMPALATLLNAETAGLVPAGGPFASAVQPAVLAIRAATDASDLSKFRPRIDGLEAVLNTAGIGLVDVDVDDAASPEQVVAELKSDFIHAVGNP
ncbi:hypothetical protein ACFT1A_02215 [Rhodococcus sp. NPDC057135]|uniref:hypothetical protein n=1 Tax=Rhodococcus sp. NPDC057135 TaxID=3346028 RepID=UPI00364237E1